VPEAPFPLDVARSFRLLRGFATEQRDPDAFYTMLAADTLALVERHCAVDGRSVLDVGGGAGYFARALAAAGARAAVVDVDLAELTADTGGPEPLEAAEPAPARSVARTTPATAVMGDGCRLPFGTGVFDVCHSSNVIEHVNEPRSFFDEMLRVVRPGGTVFLAFTNCWSPFGGHETSPWHYVGGERAALRYERLHGGKPPKNRFGQSLFQLHIGQVLGWARSTPSGTILATYPRYYPRWAWGVAHVPGVREVLTWNLVVVLRRSAR
jgi:SAM-dependent methyltransferase